MAHLKGPHREVKAGYRQRERNRTLGTCFHQGPHVECSGVPGLWPDQSIQAKRGRFW